MPPPEPAGKVNTTDPDSKNLKAFRGYVQGYNAQAVVTAQQIVIAAEVNVDPQDFSHLGPMVTAAQAELERAGVNDRVGAVVADAGYWHFQQMDELAAKGIPVLIPPDSSKRKTARPGWDGGRYAWMRRLLASDRWARAVRTNATRRSSRSSDRSSTTARSTASNDEDAPPRAPNGD